MAHMWVQLGDEVGEWVIVSLDNNGEAFLLTGDPSAPVVAYGDKRGKRGGAYIIRHRNLDGSESYQLFASAAADVHVNGSLVALGTKVLKDKDEIRVGKSRPMLFSTERQARVKNFPGIGKPAMCPRCKQEIQMGTPAVRCPNCGVWYHQTDELPCWTYSQRCSLCPHSTSLEAGFSWTPETL